MEIKKLTLFSKNLDEQEHIYGNILGFPVERISETKLKVHTKENVLFKKNSITKPKLH